MLPVAVKTDLHRLTANLAVLDIGLAAGRQIDHDAHPLAAIRAADSTLHDHGADTVRPKRRSRRLLR